MTDVVGKLSLLVVGHVVELCLEVCKDVLGNLTNKVVVAIDLLKRSAFFTILPYFNQVDFLALFANLLLCLFLAVVFFVLHICKLFIVIAEVIVRVTLR